MTRYISFMATLRPTVELLRSVPVLGALGEADLQRILDAADNSVMTFAPYEVIFAEGDPADSMYIVLEGAADVRIKSVGDREISIATIKVGQFFGEQSLMPGSTGLRNASVRALMACTVLRIAGALVSAGMSKADRLSNAADDRSPLAPQEQARLLLRATRLFRSLDQGDIDRSNEWTELEQFEAGDIILREDESAECMYIVLDGTVEVFTMDDDGKVSVLGHASRGQNVGEQGLLPDGSGKYDTSVRADTDVTLIKIGRRYVQSVLRQDDKLHRALIAVGESQRKKKFEALGFGRA